MDAEDLAHDRGWRRWLRPTLIPAAVTTAVLTLAGLYAEQQNVLIAEQNLRAEVLDHVSLIRAKLEGNINGNIQLVRGFVGTIATEPDIDQQRFSELATNLFAEDTQLRSIAAAPDMVVRLVYPLEDNRDVIGLNYHTNRAQREAALRAETTGNMVLAGPVDLVQGGVGFVARFPVYNDTGTGRSFWGVVAAVIDAERLYRDSGLTDPDLPIDVALIGKDAMGARGVLFHGDPEILENDPVTAGVVLPSGSWQISAVPREGWDATPGNAILLRAVIAAAGFIVLVPIVVAGGLMDERQAHIRKLRQREAQLARLSRRLGLALDTSKIGVWEMDTATSDLVWDDRMNELYGLAGGERSYADWRGALHPDDLERAERDFSEGIATGAYSSQFRVIHANGQVRTLRAIGSVYADPGENRRIVGVNWDVTADVSRSEALEQARRLTEARNRQLEAAKARIEHNALHDSLTGLPNRRYLDETLKAHGERADRADIALLHIDLDRFKQINDTLGHAAGDAVLVHAAKVLRRNVGSGDFVARIGGDEFVIVCSAAAGEAALGALADRIIADMRVPIVYKGHECRCGVSVGIAIGAAGLDGASLMIDADIALYRAKVRGRSRHEFFSEALQAEVIHTKRLADEILNGLERGEFVAWYQPQFDAHTHALAGVEALARWQHPVLGLLTPDRFLAVAEDLNAVSAIDRAILEQALADFDGWRREGLGVPRVSVNVSLRRLHDENLIAGLRELAFTRGTVSFELVESIYLDERDETVAWNIDQLKELGIDIEIDDFGTGYASIVSLQNLRPKRLKIDRQLVAPIDRDPAQWRLLSSIVDIGKALGIEVIAEGVETMEHARILADLGCDVLQGYAFARAMERDALKSFLAARPQRRAS